MWDDAKVIGSWWLAAMLSLNGIAHVLHYIILS